MATSKSRALLTRFPDLLDSLQTHTITPGSKLAFSYIAGTLPGLEEPLRTVLTRELRYPADSLTLMATCQVDEGGSFPGCFQQGATWPRLE